jgi:hypothetical protein
VALTRLQARTLVQQLIDDPSAKLWSAANLDVLAEGVIDELWADLLDHWPYLRSTETAVTGAEGKALGTLTRFYRLQLVSRGSKVYTPADPKDAVFANAEVLSAESRTYTIINNEVFLFPLESSPDFYLRYSTRPTGFAALASDATAVEWPDGHHMAYIYAIAARAMEKGDREQSERFEKRAEVSLLKLKATLRKQHTGPIMPFMPDSGHDWGGV